MRPRPHLCERCGNAPPDGQKIHAHHIDYTRPELIAWLCVKCHRAEHRATGIDWQQLWNDADRAPD